MRRFIGAVSATALVIASGLLASGPASAGPEVAGSPVTSAAAVPDVAGLNRSLSRAAANKLGLWLKQFKGSAFNSVISIGDPGLYLAALGSSTVRLKRGMSSVALYDPDTSTVWLSQDPRPNMSRDDAMIIGQSVWHELTHAREFANGDSSLAVNTEAWAEHRIDYMNHLTTYALPMLEQLEKKAKAGASVASLRAIWQRFLQRYQSAAGLASTSVYPVDPNELQAWFGFDVDPDIVKAFYLSGQFLPGKPGRNLREALDPTPEEASSAPIAGTWNVGNGTVKVTAEGSGFVGTVTKTITGFVCAHPVGETIWRMSGSGTSYVGSARLNITGGNTCTSDMDTATFSLLSSNMLQVNYRTAEGSEWTLYLAYR